MSENTFACDACHVTFDKAWTDEEAVEESLDIFGLLDPSDMAVVCDECFAAMGLAQP